MSKIGILGAGMMGGALAVPLADRGHDVRLVGTHLDEAIVASLARDRVHPTLGLALPDAVRPFPLDRIDEALGDADILALGVSSAGLHWAGQQLRPFVRAERPLFMITKGLELHAGRVRILPDALSDDLPDAVRPQIRPMAVGGPCIAGELARRVDSCVVLAGRDAEAARRLAAELSTGYYHVFVHSDAVGALACAALKNAYAMAVGFAAGIHKQRGGEPGSVAMHNYESAVFAQSIREMRLWVRAFGGDPDTVVELAGVGDLDVTNNGGRTGRFGRLLGEGHAVSEAVAAMHGATLECLEIVAELRPALALLTERGDLLPGALPLFEHMAAVVLDGAPVRMPFERFFGGRA